MASLLDTITSRPATEQKVAIVTGSTSGIGSWLAEHLHARGYRVAVCGRREADGQSIASNLDPAGNTAIFVRCDIKSYDSQAQLFQTVWKKWGRLDVLVANAGCVDRGSLYNFARRNAAVDDLPAEPDLSCTDIDLKGTIYGTTLATHFMRNNPGKKGGKIIVTGSMIGVYPCPTFPEYCAAKAAVHQWVRTMAPVLAKKEDITINCIMPGGIETPAMPDFSTAFLPEHMTLKTNLISGYDLFLDDAKNTRTGETIEAAHDTLIPWSKPEYKSGAFAKRTEKVYDPWFALVHGETSDLAEAMKAPPTKGPKIIAVTGATGSQGGGVVNVMKKTPGWKVRAITRNPVSEAAKKLEAEGVEVVQASFNDEVSLAKAFEGVHAVFAVTNWWEHLAQGKSQDESGVLEEEQGMNIARAAASTDTLEQPHMDYKANVDARIKSELPDFPLIKPIEYPGNGQWIQTIPSKSDAKVLLSGDMTVNPGIWVRQALATGIKAYEKYANVALEKWTFQEMIDVWSEITGNRGVFVETTIDAWTKLWGPAGNELGLQFKFGEMCDPWEENDGDFISPKELGIDEKEVIGFRGTIEGLKHMF